MGWSEFWTGAARYPLKRLCYVNLKTGKAFRGVLYERQREFLVLKGAELFDAPRSAPVPIDGDVVIERQHVEFIQVLGERR